MRTLVACLFAGGLCALPMPASAQAPDRPFVQPKLLESSDPDPGAVGREVRYTLPIRYRKGTIFNPATGKHDAVELRSYSDGFAAPTIVIKPGYTIRITLKNELPADGCVPNADINVPKCFNATNLHAHGLWVSPAGNSDNVLLAIDPGVTFQYEYNVPQDHPAGTFWYHPHKHGSTALQVGSGMAGVLVVQGDRPPTATANGDIDTLLKRFGSQVMLFEQIPYACFDSAGKLQADAAGRWFCNDGQVGRIEDFHSQIAVFPWDTSGRFTTVNRQTHPRMQLSAGRVYRWRLVNAAIYESIAMRIAKIAPVPRPAQMTKDQEHAFVTRACSGAVVNQWEIATDGLTRSSIARKSVNHLQPGYRSDVLVAFPEDGEYCIFDDASPEKGSVSAAAENPRLLAFVTVKGGRAVKGDMAAFVTRELLKAADDVPAGVRGRVKADLRDGLKTAKFVPHPSVTDDEVKGTTPQTLAFNMGPLPNNGFEWGVDGKSYDPDRMDRTLVLGTAQEWNLTSARFSHPFHIHVNPFQVVSVKNRTTGAEVTDGQYAGMKGAWKDTIWVQDDVEVTIRTRYRRYIGAFVLHCHILQHEDQGMMQNVQIVMPDAKGSARKPGHH